ncbi:hypothetical protein NM208_g2338 [Fusarium decemcellulare]|uniref:Uncharacterized protein n=1 Tax=Fusarium decemcellulare TaxID=57161 RepID=A0ACC1SSS8_9HYPO|nr:hypothetical protein NM208_g2338 [Fusarium decemcellulare]
MVGIHIYFIRVAEIWQANAASNPTPISSGVSFLNSETWRVDSSRYRRLGNVPWAVGCIPIGQSRVAREIQALIMAIVPKLFIEAMLDLLLRNYQECDASYAGSAHLQCAPNAHLEQICGLILACPRILDCSMNLMTPATKSDQLKSALQWTASHTKIEEELQQIKRLRTLLICPLTGDASP